MVGGAGPVAGLDAGQRVREAEELRDPEVEGHVGQDVLPEVVEAAPPGKLVVEVVLGGGDVMVEEGVDLGVGEVALQQLRQVCERLGVGLDVVADPFGPDAAAVLVGPAALPLVAPDVVAEVRGGQLQDPTAASSWTS